MSANATAPAADWPSPARAWWTVAVLTFAYVVSFVDRTILSLLIEPIKQSLELTDTQIGLVQGLAFALFYAAMGLPLGWLADRMSRRTLVAIGATLWCIATAACGLATSFATLFLARIGVGVGEATLGPAALSLISDSFPRERRALPIGIYTAAAAAGAGLALILGGSVIRMVATHAGFTLPFVGEVERWQAAFLLVGCAGLVIAPLMYTFREPVRKSDVAVRAPAAPAAACAASNGAPTPTAAEAAAATAAETARAAEGILPFVWRHSDFMVRHYVAVAAYSIIVYAALSWVPTQFVRVYGWGPGDVGLRYGPVLLIAGCGGTVLGSVIAGILYRRGRRDGAVLATILGMSLAGVLLFIAGRADDPWTALAWYAPALLCLTLPGGTAVQVVQEAVPNRLRGQATGIYYLVNSLVGATLGPLSVGLMTDYVFHDPRAIGEAIGLVAIVIAPATALLAVATRRPFLRLAHGVDDPVAPAPVPRRAV
jgi:MFS family permease